MALTVGSRNRFHEPFEMSCGRISHSQRNIEPQSFDPALKRTCSLYDAIMLAVFVEQLFAEARES